MNWELAALETEWLDIQEAIEALTVDGRRNARNPPMSPELTERLFAEFLPLFRGRHLPITQNLMGLVFECEDGWYELIRQLAANITAHAARAGLNPLAVQVKQEFGTCASA